MDKIAPAFVKAQRAFAPALKTNTNPHFRSKYVALDGCIEAVIDALNANGIALLQPTHECADGVTVETLFLHESGQTMSGGKLHVPAAKNDPQGYGSALTYARRYSLMAACGIAPEDDDGNAASKPRQMSAVISAPKAAAEQMRLPKERQAYVESMAADILAAWQDGQEVAVMRAANSVTDSDEKVALWARLDDPKLRAFIKANAAKTAA